MNTKPLLKLLSDGDIHSGESLANELGVSRTAVWKQVRKLLERGIRIETIRGRGYQLAAPMDLLTAEGVLHTLAPGFRDRVALQVHDRIDSTNTDISRRWQTGERGVLVSIADSQHQGRGRRGRAWQSPPGTNLYMSVGISLTRGFAGLDGLSLVAGLALLKALSDLGLTTSQLKWPNDVLVADEKLAGILIELQGELEGAVRVIIGIGVNVHMEEVVAVDQPWTSLARCAGEIEWRRDQLAGATLNRLLEHLQVFEASGFEMYADEWNQYDALSDKKLTATSGDLSGIGRGVDGAGNYLLETSGGIRRISAGEISLRVAQ